MDARSSGATHLVRLDRGEDVLGRLTAYLEERGIAAGTITGIGALTGVTLGAYLPAQKRYEKVRLEGDWELLGLQATVALLDGRPFIHPHVVLGDATAGVRGGHLFEAVVAVTGEFTIRAADVDVSREMDPDVGLKLWRFGD
jgi:predicted DNA-binding protein with PD1-like motif